MRNHHHSPPHNNNRRAHHTQGIIIMQIDKGVVGLRSNTAVVLDEEDKKRYLNRVRSRSDSNNLNEDGVKQIIWGSEDEATLLKKTEKWKALREQARVEMERQITPLDAVLASLVVGMLHKIAQRLKISSFRLVFSTILLLLARGIYRSRAPARSGQGALEYFTTWPIFGQIGIIRSALVNSGAVTSLKIARVRNFQSGEVVMFGGTRDCSVMDPKDREHFFKTNWKNYVKNAGDGMTFQKAFSEVMGRGIFAVDGDEWQDHRKVASHLFSANGLKSKMESSFISHGKILVEMVTEHIPQDKVVNFQELMQGFTFSSICDIAFGVETHALEEGVKGNKIDFLVQFDRIQQMSVLRIILPEFVTKLMRYLNVGSEKLIREDAKEIRKYVNKIVRDRKENKDLEQKEDLLSLYIKTARATGKRYIEEEEYLEDAILNFMIAGRDTTSCTLTNLFNFLSKNPSCEEKLFEEFNRVVGKGNFVTFETLRSLPYGRSVFNETIRMMPPVGTDFRVAVNDDVFPSGYKIEAGQRVSITNYTIGRDPNLWSEPDSFKPERWLVEPGVTPRRPDEYMLPVFWGGPRLCLGKDMAFLETMSVAWTIMQQFKVQVLPFDERIVNGPVMFFEYGMPAKFIRRG